MHWMHSDDPRDEASALGEGWTRLTVQTPCRLPPIPPDDPNSLPPPATFAIMLPRSGLRSEERSVGQRLQIGREWVYRVVSMGCAGRLSAAAEVAWA